MSSSSPPDVEMTFEETSDTLDLDFQENPLHPIAILMDELKHAELTIRLNAIQKLDTIALALGPERTRSELMKFLQESMTDEEDEIVLTLATELGKFTDFVGGPEHAHHLFLPLEVLCGFDEPLVRLQAIQSIENIVDVLSNHQLEEYFLPMLTRMCDNHWFTMKMSAAQLYPKVFQRFASQEDALEHFLGLLHDDSPMVRRAAATSLSAIVKNVSRETLEHKLMPSFIQIASDDQDSVRLLSLDILLALAGAVNKDTEFLETHLFPILKNLFEDHSWRVHYVLAEKFSMIATQIYPCSKETPVDSSIDWAAELLLRFVKLLNDEEGEVRTIACKSLAQVCPLFVPLDVQKHVLPALRLLSSDRSDFVRSRLALEISEISGAVDKDSVIRSLLPILVSLLKDENSEVRLNVISKLEKMNQVIGIELLSQYLLPAIVELSNDTQWRVRLAIVEHMPLLAEQLGPEFFNGSLKDLCLAFLGDSVYAVRMATVNSLGSIMNTYGATWAKAEIFPQMMAQSEQVHYLYRLMTLFSINYFVPLLDIVSSKEFFIPVLKRLVTDKVPNIRLNVAKTIAIMAKTLIEKDLSQATSMIQSFLLPALTNLQNDPDEDVQYYAQKSIHEIEAL